MAAGSGRIVVSLKFGRTRGARFDGEPRPVLAALGIVMLCLVGMVYLAATTPGCSHEQAVRLATMLLTDGPR